MKKVLIIGDMLVEKLNERGYDTRGTPRPVNCIIFGETVNIFGETVNINVREITCEIGYEDPKPKPLTVKGNSRQVIVDNGKHSWPAANKRKSHHTKHFHYK